MGQTRRRARLTLFGQACTFLWWRSRSRASFKSESKLTFVDTASIEVGARRGGKPMREKLLQRASVRMSQGVMINARSRLRALGVSLFALIAVVVLWQYNGRWGITPQFRTPPGTLSKAVSRRCAEFAWGALNSQSRSGVSAQRHQFSSGFTAALGWMKPGSGVVSTHRSKSASWSFTGPSAAPVDLTNATFPHRR